MLIRNIQHSSRTVLMHAAQHGEPAMLTVLLGRGAPMNDVDGLGWSALDYASNNQRPANAELLRAKGLKPNSVPGG